MLTALLYSKKNSDNENNELMNNGLSFLMLFMTYILKLQCEK